MKIRKSFRQLITGGFILFLVPTSALAAIVAVRVSGTVAVSAIDTLTVEDDASFLLALSNTGTIRITGLSSGNDSTTVRNRIVALGANDLNCNIFRIQRLDSPGKVRFQINTANPTALITSIKLNSQAITGAGVFGLSGIKYTLDNSAPLGFSIGPCTISSGGGKAVPITVSTLIILPILLAIAAIYWLRKRQLAAMGESFRG